MNPRIQELAKEAGFEIDNGPLLPGLTTITMKVGGLYVGVPVEKFAELVIAECCQYLNNEIDRLNQYRAALESEPQRNEIFIAEIDVCIDKCQDNILGLREHFGVEE